ncbi:MAG: hypothetical protein FWD65_01595 [Coriobacteriia bacterium]|nr:hypothetical protein [Coriobacteriia bacterium]
MKKKYFYISILMVAVLLLAACGKKPAAAQQDLPPTASQEATASVVATTSPSGAGDSKQTQKNGGSPANTSSKKTYSITTAKISQGEINIKYPQITGLPDKGRQGNINSLIKRTIYNDALDGYSEALSQKQLSVDVSYRVMLSTDNLLSIAYTEEANVETAAHPNASMIGTTIDLKRVKVVKLSSLVSVDKAFAQKLLTSSGWTYLGGTPKDNILSQELKNNYPTSSDLLADIQGVNSNFYLKPNSLVVSVGISHAIGDYALVELRGNYAAGYKN